MANNIIGRVGIGAQSVKPDWNQNDPNANNIIGTVGVGAQSVKPDWNQNDPNAKDYIKNRPGGYAFAPSLEITWDGDTTGKETVDTGAGVTMVKIADEAPPIDEFAVGTSYKAVIMSETTYSDGSNETAQKQIDLSYQEDFWMGQNLSLSSMAIGVTVDSVSIEGLTLTKGLWFSIVDGPEVPKVITCGISTTDGSVKKFPESFMPDEVWSRISDAQDMAKTAKITAKTAVKPTKNNENECWYSMRNPYAEYGPTVMALGPTGGTALEIKVNEKYPSVAFIPPVHGSSQADFEFRKPGGAYRHPLITGIGGIVVYSSTPNSNKKFKITVDDTGTISATEVTT